MGAGFVLVEDDQGHMQGERAFWGGAEFCPGDGHFIVGFSVPARGVGGEGEVSPGGGEIVHHFRPLAGEGDSVVFFGGA